MNKNQVTNEAAPRHVFQILENNNIKVVRMVQGRALPELLPIIYNVIIQMSQQGPELVLSPSEVKNPPKVIYGNLHKDLDRYFRRYEKYDENLGVLLVGQKGSGKTTQLRCMTKTAQSLGMPVILVNQQLPFGPFNDLMAGISQNCLVCFDEYDKYYGEVTEDTARGAIHNQQTGMLALLDGTIGGGKKLVVLIANEISRISPFLIGRPSRVRYTQFFNVLPYDVLNSYVKENLVNFTELKLLHLNFLKKINFDLNFDQLSAVVMEMNDYPQDSAFSTFAQLFGKNEGCNSFECFIIQKDSQNQDIDFLGTQCLTDGVAINVYNETGFVTTLTDDDFVSMENNKIAHYKKDDKNYEVYFDNGENIEQRQRREKLRELIQEEKKKEYAEKMKENPDMGFPIQIFSTTKKN